MITTLLGKNSFVILEKKQQIINVFMAEVGSLGIERYDHETEAQTIHDALSNLPFLVEKKLVVIDEPSKNKELSDKLSEWLNANNPHVDVLIIEPGVDKRTAWYKYLTQNSEVVLCEDLDEQNARAWIREYIKNRGASITEGAIAALINNVGPNQEQLSNEISKLLNYNPAISEENVKLLVEPMPQETVFGLLEALTNGDKDRTIHLYDALRLSGVEANEVLAMIGWQTHTVLLVKSSLHSTQESSGLHPYVIQKNTKLAKKLTMKDLEKLVSLTAEAELSIKKDGISSENVVSVLIFKILELLK